MMVWKINIIVSVREELFISQFYIVTYIEGEGQFDLPGPFFLRGFFVGRWLGGPMLLLEVDQIQKLNWN